MPSRTVGSFSLVKNNDYRQRVGLLTLLVLLTLTFTVTTSTHAGIPANNYHYAYADGGHIRDAGNPADTRQDSVGYSANARLSGNTINTAAVFARDRFFQERGAYEGVDKYSTWGNGGQKITPAGFK